jgi:hypothetical protein
MVFPLSHIYTVGKLTISRRSNAALSASLKLDSETLTLACLIFKIFYVYMFYQTNSNGETKLRTGATMSIVGAMIPLSAVVTASWVGYLETTTAMATIPMFLCFGYSCLSALVFLCVGKV